MKCPMTDLRVQKSEKSIQAGMSKKHFMRNVGFELVLVDGKCLGKWEYDWGHYLMGGIAHKSVQVARHKACLGDMSRNFKKIIQKISWMKV